MAGLSGTDFEAIIDMKSPHNNHSIIFYISSGQQSMDFDA
jgi:hypothetical protein